MPITAQQLINNYADAIDRGDAALFIGAGLSRPSGFVDWKGLLKECAEELGLDLDREHDLVAVAQYYLNRRSRDRSRLNQILQNEFTKPGSLSENHHIIARLPVDILWTTNFDHLIEEAFQINKRVLDVKAEDRNIAYTTPHRAATLYKMHGDIARPDELVICKDDFERYARKHTVFQNALEGDLVSQTFLFLGFSFADPNLEYMLGHLRTLLEDSKREHYAIIRSINRTDYGTGKDGVDAFQYDLNKQTLRIEDLQRYSIQVCLINDYPEITGILQELERRSHFRDVFVSGSAYEYGSFGEARMRALGEELGRRLIQEDRNLVSGFGLSIGDAVILGALSALYEAQIPTIERRLHLMPFPQTTPVGMTREQFTTHYRTDLLARAGFAVFIAGNKSGEPCARGVMEELEIARKLGKIPIPLGVTGFAAAEIWKLVDTDFDTIYSGRVTRDLFNRLNDPSLSETDLVTAVFDIIKQIG